jgi:hypothetical protein
MVAGVLHFFCLSLVKGYISIQYLIITKIEKMIRAQKNIDSLMISKQ